MSEQQQSFLIVHTRTYIIYIYINFKPQVPCGVKFSYSTFQDLYKLTLSHKLYLLLRGVVASETWIIIFCFRPVDFWHTKCCKYSLPI